MSDTVKAKTTRELTPLKFRFKGKIARLLGRESVSDSIVALTELVKNAYDADATKVLISFEEITTGKGLSFIELTA
jgi:hypothetical protein